MLKRCMIIAAAALVATTVSGQAPTTSTTEKRPVSDALFAAAAADSGLAEVTISQIGLTRATDADLKRFSQTMIDDHSKANAELMSLANVRGVALPRTIDPRSQFCAQSLAGLSGEEFDRCYAKAQCAAHEEAITAFETEIERGQDPEIKAFASRVLPKIKQHHEMIKPIAKRLEKANPSAASERK